MSRRPCGKALIDRESVLQKTPDLERTGGGGGSMRVFGGADSEM